MKHISIENFINETYDFFKFVEIAKKPVEQKEDEYYVLLVIDPDYPRNKSPHVKAISFPEGKAIVGIEKSSGEYNFYIDKNFYKRKNGMRGITVSVKVLVKSKCCNLTDGEWKSQFEK